MTRSLLEQKASCTSSLLEVNASSRICDRVIRSIVIEEGLQAKKIVPLSCPMSLSTILALDERLGQVTSTLGRGLMAVTRQTPVEAATANFDAMSRFLG